MMGLATAYYLNRQGVRATVLEKHREVGGLSRSMQMPSGIRWDRYYHVILSTDTELLEFIDELGLSPEVAFMETKTGFFTDGQLFSMSNAWEFLKFRPLSLVDKLRLGTGIVFALPHPSP